LFLVASTLAGLNARKKPSYCVQQIWPPGTPQPLTKQLAAYFFDLLSTSERSLLELLRAHPELPPFKQLDSWRVHNKHGFAEKWKHAGELRAHFLAEKCLDIQHNANPKNAHSQRVKFDVLKWMCAKLNPTFYGDKPATTAVNVAVGFNVSPERLQEIRGKLDMTRNTLADSHKALTNGNRIQEHHSTNGDAHSVADTSHSIPEDSPLVRD
jgi:hypothetical protein